VLGDEFLLPRVAGATQAAVHQAERAVVQQADLALVAQALQADIEVDQVLQRVLLVVVREAPAQGAALQVVAPVVPVVPVLQVAVQVGPAVLQVAEVDAQAAAPEADPVRDLVVRSVVVAV
jgi:hypothetical protein